MRILFRSTPRLPVQQIEIWFSIRAAKPFTDPTSSVLLSGAHVIDELIKTYDGDAAPFDINHNYASLMTIETEWGKGPLNRRNRVRGAPNERCASVYVFGSAFPRGILIEA